MKKTDREHAEKVRMNCLNALEVVSDTKSVYYQLKRIRASKEVLSLARNEIKKARNYFEVVKEESLKLDYPNIARLERI